MTIGERIRAEREKRSWSRHVLCLKTGYTERTITNWEKDVHKPSEAAIRSVETAFGTKLRK